MNAKIVLSAIAGALLAWGLWHASELGYMSFLSHQSPLGPVLAAQVSSPFVYRFDEQRIDETANPIDSRNAYWWVNSGAALVSYAKSAGTLRGILPVYHRFRLEYDRHNPLDTDQGYRPQNIFRLVSRQDWNDVLVELAFTILRDNTSASPNKNASNGVLIMSRYKDGETLYYAGIRVDGTAVIKKKYKGTYYTLAQAQVISSTDSENNNLLPRGELLTLRSSTYEKNKQTIIELYLRRANESDFTKVVTAIDDGKDSENTPAIKGPGKIGVRTDFMDVSFASLIATKM